MKTLKTLDELNSFISANSGATIYYSHEDCNVCKVLKPKLVEFLEENFPEIKPAYVDVRLSNDISAQNSIFAVPTVIFYLEGKEFIRKSRNLSFGELYDEISRPYEMVFGN
ncbi:MAG: thiol reductase thioredoxin [Melioribacteraceae bacterium]|nr:MAG: thiol reductase thioredoxin [Melioribacteraceae bacterium]